MHVPYTGKSKRHNPERRVWRGVSYKKAKDSGSRRRVRDLRDAARRAADAEDLALVQQRAGALAT